MKSLGLIFGLVLLVSVCFIGGCATSTVNVLSDQALERSEPEDRAKYRSTLDKADMGIDAARLVLDKAKDTVGQAKDAYDRKYNPDGTVKEEAPAPEPAPVE